MPCPCTSNAYICSVYSKRQNRGKEIEKCLDEGLEPTYHFSIFILYNNKRKFYLFEGMKNGLFGRT